MNETSCTMQLGYMLDTNIPRYRDLMASPAALRARLVDAGIERARRVSGLSVPRGIGTGANWKPVLSRDCCSQAGAGKLFEHCKGAEHVATEYSLSDAAIPSVESLAQLLVSARLAGAMPNELNENGLRGAILAALNDSWRRLYRVPGRQASDCEEVRLASGMRSSDDVFAERLARRAGRRAEGANSRSAYLAPRMAPGA
ncbi:hypothetical protein ACG04R_16405 [Roseateles sp. BYS78W]|uniref:Uncharacterized protein n=1 Tax=Pelomonas candidula TaxID=3299025 RepID=A0ABW7HED1_9BURK